MAFAAASALGLILGLQDTGTASATQNALGSDLPGWHWLRQCWTKGEQRPDRRRIAKGHLVQVRTPGNIEAVGGLHCR